MKLKRHEKIIELVNKYEIETQEELASLLNQAGFRVTQATISRDIRELRLSKVNSHDRQAEICDYVCQRAWIERQTEQSPERRLYFQYGGFQPGGCKNSYRYGHGCSNGTGCYGASGALRDVLPVMIP